MLRFVIGEMSSRQEKRNLEELNKRLGYTFHNTDLLAEAFRHSSYVNERLDLGLKDNERLEFLGDAVLDLAISHILMTLFDEANEGDLSKYRASVVNEKGLVQIAKTLGLGDYIHLGKGEQLTQGREKPSILANTLEALIGAVYLDAGFSKTKEIVRELFVPLLGKIDPGQMVNDFKSTLQEYTQELYKIRPQYLLLEEMGPAHNKTFRVALRLNDEIMAEGEGRSKKEAEQQAAKEAYFCLKKDGKGL
jgi:ribonuclease-3